MDWEFWLAHYIVASIGVLLAYLAVAVIWTLITLLRWLISRLRDGREAVPFFTRERWEGPFWAFVAVPVITVVWPLVIVLLPLSLLCLLYCFFKRDVECKEAKKAT